MHKTKRLLALAMALCLLFCMTVSAWADTTIDSSKTGSLTIYKYDLTRAEAAGALSSGTYVSTGQHDQNVVDALASYVVPGVEFIYLKLADVGIDYDGTDVNTLYGFRDTSFLNAIGLSTDSAHHENGGTYYYSSDAVTTALSAAIAADSTGVKNLLEALVKTNGTAMTLTDEYGKTTATGLPLGLYLVVETKVPQNVTSTCDPFIVSLPMTGADGTTWNYDVTVYPKSRTGVPTLEKSVREAGTQNYAASASASAGDVLEYRIVSTLPTITSTATSLSKYSFADRIPTSIAYNKGDVLIKIFKDSACSQLVSTWDESSGKFAVSYTPQGMTVDVTLSGLTEINTANTVHGTDSVNRGYSDCTMVITYGCTLASDSSLVCGDAGNLNTVQLTWARSNPDETDSLTDHAHVYTYAVDMLKRFSDGNGDFSKVSFLLYNETDSVYIKAKQMDGIYYVSGCSADKTSATTFVPAANGKIQIIGLEADNYSAIETATDAAYNLLKDGVKIGITLSNGAACNICGKPTLTAKATVNTKEVSMTGGNASVPLTVVNTKGFELPKTGSYGTWMFTVGGVLAMGIAAFAIYKLLKKED